MERHQEAIQRMAASIERAGLRTPALIVLDLLTPLDVISSQIAQFARPLVHGTRLDSYAEILAEAASWHELRTLLSRQ